MLRNGLLMTQRASDCCIARVGRDLQVARAPKDQLALYLRRSDRSSLARANVCASFEVAAFSGAAYWESKFGDMGHPCI
jgi:hypothetical protein